MSQTLFDSFLEHARGANLELHADLTLIAYLTHLPEKSVIQAQGSENMSSVRFVYTAPGCHGAFTISHPSPKLKHELTRWLAGRETLRSLEAIFNRPAPEDESL